MARFITLSATTASVSSGGGTLGVDVAVTGGASLLRIVKIKVSFSAGTGNSTFEIFTKDTKLAADRIYIAEDFNVTLHDFADTSSGTAAEFQEGASIIEYEDEDASGEVHLKFTNDDSVNKTYTYTLLVEECPLFDSSRVMTVQKAELLGDILYFGGRTSSHAMWKREVAGIASRLGDDSAYSHVNGLYFNAANTGLQYFFGAGAATHPALKRSSADLLVRLGDDSGYANLIAAGLMTSSSILWLGGSSASEVSLRRSSTTMRARLGDDSAYCNFEALDFHAKGDNYFFGGTTTSYPMLKRSSAEAQIRLGDDSGYAGLRCQDMAVEGTLTAGNGVSGTFTTSVTVSAGIVTGGS